MWNSELSLRPISALKPPPRSGFHPECRLKQLSSSVAAFGFATPILVDANGTIVAGQGRVEAGKALGFLEVPCLMVEALTEDEKQHYFHTHQKLAIEAGWDESLLASELEGLFEPGRRSYPAALDERSAREDILDEGPDGPPITRSGDLWILGEHRLICGPAATDRTYRQLLGKERAQLTFNDPCCQADADRADAAAVGQGQISAELASVLTSTFEKVRRYGADDSIHFVCSDWRHMQDIVSAGEAVFEKVENVIIWIKDPEGGADHCGSGHELVFVFRTRLDGSPGSPGDGPTLPTGRDVWRHRGVPDVRLDAAGEAMMLPSRKPVEMLADAIRESTDPGAIVLDAFCGSGTILLAAEKTARQARAIEPDPRNCDAAIRRWQNFAGREAVLAGTLETFGKIAERSGA